MVDSYVEICLALAMLASATLFGVSVVLSHIAIGG